MQASGLDNLEPYAFIGCWLQRRGQFSSAQAHMAWKPSKEDVVAYAQAQEWVSMASEKENIQGDYTNTRPVLDQH